MTTKTSNMNKSNYESKVKQKLKKKLVAILLIIIAVAVAAAILYRPPAPTLAITHVYNITEPGQTFEVNITISDVSGMTGWAVDLTWDPYIIKVTTIDENGLEPVAGKGTYYNIYEGPFLKSVRSTLWLVMTINNKEGKITGLTAGYSEVAGETASGSGLLATINFTSVRVGTTTIEIGPKSIVQDDKGKKISYEARHGLVTEHEYVPPPIWTEFWFQATIVVIEVVILAVPSYVIVKKKRVQVPTEKQEKS